MHDSNQMARLASLSADDTINLLKLFFSGRLIKGDYDWPPRSPDLTPLNFYLWEYLSQTSTSHGL